MILLLDIGNTHTHVGLAAGRVTKHANFATDTISSGRGLRALKRFVGSAGVTDGVVCSVVPRVTGTLGRGLREMFGIRIRYLNARTLRGMGIDYPEPATIGADRLANALAAKIRFGAPSVVVDFGTAVTFDVVNRSGDYAGGIIAPGLAMMTSYLHEKTALLPRIRIRDTRAVIGKSTEEAMLIGAVHGYRGLVGALLLQLKRELNSPRLPVVATGGYAKLVAGGMKEIRSVEPNLTLEGLRLLWELWEGPGLTASRRSATGPRSQRTGSGKRV